MNNKATISYANKLFQDQKYDKALSIYLEIVNYAPELEKSLRFNIETSRRRVSGYSFSNGNQKQKIVLVNTNYQTKNLHITRAIFNALERHERIESVVYTDYANLVNSCQKFKPDILLAIDGQKINAGLIQRASCYAQKTVLWTFDDPYTTRDSLKYQKIFDLICSNDEGSVDKYEYDACYLPLASPLLRDFFDEREPVRDDNFDIFFCGTAWPNRIDDLNKLIKARPKLNYRLSLPYNAHVPKKRLDKLPVTSYIFPLNFMDFLRTSMHSKITLGLHRSFGENKDNDSSVSPGPRIFEVAGSNSFQIVDASCGAGNFYQNEQEICLYNDFDDMIEKIDYFIENDVRRLELSEAAFEKTRTQHTYTNRIDFILSKLSVN